jgi:hypothetical protein
MTRRNLGWLLCVAIMSVGLVARAQVGPRPTSVRTQVGLHGLVALATTDEWDRVLALVLDTARVEHAAVAQHHPVLIMPMDAVAMGAPDSFDANGHAIWELKGLDVWFERPERVDPRIVPIHTAGGVEYPTTREEWRDVRWIADLERLIGREAATVNPRYVTGTLSGDGRVAARIHLDGGTLEASEPAAPHNAEVFQFLPLRGAIDHPIQQPLTDRIVFTPTPSHGLRIVLKPSDGRPTRTVELKTTMDAIPIEIASLPTAPARAVAGTAGEASHFEAFYDLLDTPADKRLIPGSPIPVATATAAATDVVIWCPGGSMRLPR